LEYCIPLSKYIFFDKKGLFSFWAKSLDRYTQKKEKRRFIEDQEKSSLSVRDYCQSRNISTYLNYHWKRRFKIEDSPVETDAVSPQFRQIIKPAQVSGLSMTLPNWIRIGLDSMSMEDFSRLLVNMGRYA
jgi:hypothetical protein